MPSIDVVEKEDTGGTVSQPIIGIIYPPPEVRSILLKNIQNCPILTSFRQKANPGTYEY